MWQIWSEKWLCCCYTCRKHRKPVSYRVNQCLPSNPRRSNQYSIKIQVAFTISHSPRPPTTTHPWPTSPSSLTRSSTVNSRSGHASGLRACRTSSAVIISSPLKSCHMIIIQHLYHITIHPATPGRDKHLHSLQTNIAPTRKLTSSNFLFAGAALYTPLN